MSECPACGESDQNWDKIAEYAIDGPYHAGIIIVAECGRCGERIEGSKP